MRDEASVATAQHIAAQFDFGAPVAAVAPYGSGLINDTFVVTTAQTPPRRFILQRINPHVFPRPRAILQNLRVLSRYWHGRYAGDHAALQMPELIPVRDGTDGVDDEKHGVWRALSYIENSRTLPALSSAAQALALGRGLGHFHAMLAGLPVHELQATLPGFHVAPGYLAKLDAIRADVKQVSADVAACFEFVDTRRAAFDVLEHAKARRQLMLRTTHGDPKLNNFLFAAAEDRVISLIDLDTVQPGLVHYDIGDCLRSACNTAGESPSDLLAVGFNWTLGRATMDGYLAAAGATLADSDRALFYDAIRLLPLELGVRFLTDYLDGDRYFKTVWPGQNLFKARVQFALARDIERYEDQIREATCASS